MDGAKEALPTNDLFPFRYHFLRFTMKEVGQDKTLWTMKEKRTTGMEMNEKHCGHGRLLHALEYIFCFFLLHDARKTDDGAVCIGVFIYSWDGILV